MPQDQQYHHHHLKDNPSLLNAYEMSFTTRLAQLKIKSKTIHKHFTIFIFFLVHDYIYVIYLS